MDSRHDPMKNQEIGDLILKTRTEMGLTQEALAEKLGVTGTYISHLEAGRRTTSLQLLRAFAKLRGSTFVITFKKTK